MQIKLTHEKAEVQDNLIVIGLYKDLSLTPTAEHIDNVSQGYIRKILEHGDIKGKVGETLLLQQVFNVRADRILLIGCGHADKLDGEVYQRIIQCAASAVKRVGTKQATSYLLELPVNGHHYPWRIQQSIITTLDNYYTFDQLKSKKKPAPQLEQLNLALNSHEAGDGCERALAHGQAIASGIKFAKDLANLPGNVCTPTYLAKQAKALHQAFSSIKVRVLEESDMQKMNMGALLSVSSGSKEPAKLVALEYFNDKAGSKAKPYVLVGKGITFDSGGISLKPGRTMDEMKFDMCGAASVLGVLRAIAELQLPINLIGIIACSENLPGGSATKPGDIVTTMSGTTVEILNTDAEGRLVLCDALTYAKKYNPKTVIDIATLTGAIVVALGDQKAGLMGNDQLLADAVLKAGETSLDPFWQLPINEAYKRTLKSNFADLPNISDGRGAGSITAACFLSHFIEDYPWVHLDIAGVAWKGGRKKGATGRPVPALIQYLINCSNA
ncbi:MAG: leucyl aminopeptidase [Gammaproteobacteria bacterium]